MQAKSCPKCGEALFRERYEQEVWDVSCRQCRRILTSGEEAVLTSQRARRISEEWCIGSVA